MAMAAVKIAKSREVNARDQGLGRMRKSENDLEVRPKSDQSRRLLTTLVITPEALLLATVNIKEAAVGRLRKRLNSWIARPK